MFPSNLPFFRTSIPRILNYSLYDMCVFRCLHHSRLSLVCQFSVHMISRRMILLGAYIYFTIQSWKHLLLSEMKKLRLRLEHMPKVTQLVCGEAAILTQAWHQSLRFQSNLITYTCHRHDVVIYSSIQHLFIEYTALDTGDKRWIIGQRLCPQRTHSVIEKWDKETNDCHKLDVVNVIIGVRTVWALYFHWCSWRLFYFNMILSISSWLKKSSKWSHRRQNVPYQARDWGDWGTMERVKQSELSWTFKLSDALSLN